jgi:hypothetical protein
VLNAIKGKIENQIGADDDLLQARGLGFGIPATQLLCRSFEIQLIPLHNEG